MKYMKKVASPVDMEKLSGDVLSNIFLRLLAKQVVQMRCVCKTWNALLSESNFVKSHLHHNKKDEILLFFKKFVNNFDTNHGPVTAFPSHSPHLELTNLMELKLPVDSQHKKAFGQVIGSVNGLICFSYQLRQDFIIRIWNPSISALLTLPPFSLSCNISYLAFGFDPKTDDYKVVHLVSLLDEPTMEPQGEVYSMRKGSWELISHRIPSNIKYFMDKNEDCVDGHLHWLCLTTDLERKPFTILAFDFGAKTFNEIPLPDPITDNLIDDNVTCQNVLGVLGGKLCVMSRVTGEYKCDVWVMDDDESWVKHHVLPHKFNVFITPYGFTSSNKFIFQVENGCRFALYDPVDAKTKNFKIKCTRQFDRYKIVEYVESLVWITPASRFKLAA